MRFKFPHTQQAEHRDCGAACLQMLCKYYGTFYELDYLKEITGTRKEGISVYDFITASEKIGFRSMAFRVPYGKFRKEVPLPCVVHWKGHHFVVVYKITRKHVYVSDPFQGHVKYTLPEFAKGWLGYVKNIKSGKRGICIVCETTDNFKTENSPQKKSSSLQALNFILGYIKPYKKSVLQIITILLIVTFINAVFPIITQSIIDIGIPTKDRGYIGLMLIATIVLGLSVTLSNWIKQLINMHFASRIKLGMLSDYLVQLFKLPLSFFENRLMGDLYQRSHDYDRIENMIMGAGFNAILAVLYLLVFGTILFVYNSVLFWIFIVANILYVLWVLMFWAIRRKMDIKYFSYLAQNNSTWIELLSKITDIKSYNYGKHKRWQWEKIQINLYKTRLKLLHVDQIQQAGANVLTTVKDGLLIYVAAVSVIEGEMTLGMLIAVQYILGQLRMPVEDIVQFIIASQLSLISFQRITEINKTQPENIAESENDRVLDYDKGMMLKNIYFKYSVNEDYVLTNVSMFIPKGKVIALVGESGCGKSTIIKLLMQLYNPVGGSICLGNMNISNISVNKWRERCGILSQESSLLKDTVTNNIVFGRDFDKDKLLKSVKIANIRKEIELFRAGYDTMLGESGRGVSEGQKQRILFARAIYDDPEFIFLDEITSSLDSRNETSIIDSIHTSLKDKTVVIAAHRLSSIINADIIYVLKNGQVVEQGNHEILINQKKEYYNLFMRQIQRETVDGDQG